MWLKELPLWSQKQKEKAGNQNSVNWTYIILECFLKFCAKICQYKKGYGWKSDLVISSLNFKANNSRKKKFWILNLYWWIVMYSKMAVGKRSLNILNKHFKCITSLKNFAVVNIQYWNEEGNYAVPVTSHTETYIN